MSCFVLVNFLAYGPLFSGAAAAATPAAKPAAAKPAAAKPAAGKQVTGTQLLAESKKAVAGILKETKASGGKLDPKSKKQAPFFAGLKEFQAALGESEKKLKAKDKKLFESLSKGSKALAKVKTAWPRVGVQNAKVDGYLGKLDNSFTALRSRYGGEGLRAKQGADLSAKEKANFEKIKASQAEFSKKLAPMQAKAKQKGDKGTEAQLARLVKQSNAIAVAQLTVDAFMTALLLLDYLEGEWDCYSYYVGPSYRADWVAMDVWVSGSFTTYDTLYWDTVGTYSVETWEYWDVPMELDVDYEITDVYDADLVATDAYFDASFEYDELGWEDYSTEFGSAEMEDTLYEEEDVNLDVAAEVWEDEGLEVDAGDDLLDEEDAEEFDDDDADVEVAEAEADAAEAEADLADAEADAADAEADAADAEADAADAEADAGDDDAEADDAEGDDEGDDAEGDAEDDDAEGDDEGDDAEGDDEGDDAEGDDEAEDDVEEEEEEEEAEDDGGDDGGDEERLGRAA
ncbi:MAG: hypothetical protein KBF21_10150 [Thermoanaerobaculia bacterium]|nr:hypothetical protein [Thermoanaerobaculia bacterium]MBP9824574.1 hypothetical protein [Thermoanaerobaculia bacterium]